jgi:DNA-binding NarL/FixJ family response regulator
MKNIRVLIIDEHPAVCQALTSRLGAVPTVTVVGAVSDFSEGLCRLGELQPDVILLELKVKSKREERRRDLDPVVAINRLNESSGAGVIVLTTYLDDAERERALRAGARRYLLKQIDTARLVIEIEAVAAGREVRLPDRERTFPLLLGDGRATLDKAVDNIQERD